MVPGEPSAAIGAFFGVSRDQLGAIAVGAGNGVVLGSRLAFS
jgi:hypothetical protein